MDKHFNVLSWQWYGFELSKRLFMSDQQQQLELKRKWLLNKLNQEPTWCEGYSHLGKVLLSILKNTNEKSEALISQLKSCANSILEQCKNGNLKACIFDAHYFLGMAAFYSNLESNSLKSTEPQVIVVATDPHPGLDRLHESCKRNGLELHIAGMGQQFQANGLIPILLANYLQENIADDQCILCVDAYDVIVYGPREEIATKFLSFKAPMVFSAEINCWPDPQLHTRYPKSPTKNRFLNAGCFMTYAGVLKKVLFELNFKAHWLSNQRHYVRYFLDHLDLIKLDYHCQLFQNLYLTPLEDLSFKEQRFYNENTGEVPCLMHANGDDGLKKLALIEEGGIASTEKDIEEAPYDPSQEAFAKRFLKIILLMNYWPESFKKRIKELLPRLRVFKTSSTASFLRLFNKEIDFIYNENYAKDPRRNKEFSDDFCAVLQEVFNPQSIIDIGCATGDFLASFHKMGKEILGVDASKANFKHRQIAEEQFILSDIRKGFVAPSKYDLCLCLSVAEHLSKKYSQHLLKILTAASDTIVFSATAPGQGAPGICNPQPRSWWVQSFESLSFVYDEETTHKLKRKLAEIKTSEHTWTVELQKYIVNLAVLRRS